MDLADEHRSGHTELLCALICVSLDGAAELRRRVRFH